MVDLGQKKVDSHPPFFMSCREIKKPARIIRAGFFKLLRILFILSVSC